jgi:thiamine biosynthesis lipoprotein
MLRLNLRDGALATSSVTSRAWGPGLHQLIDPRTGRPAATEAIQATAWAPTCAEAEIRAKWLLLEGAAALAQVPGVIAFDDGRLVTNVDRDNERIEVVA